MGTCAAENNACGANGACVDSTEGFYCVCDPGYQRSADRKSCVGEYLRGSNLVNVTQV